MASDTPPIYAGPAQHTYTRACDGFHQPGPCPAPVAVTLPAATLITYTGAPDA